uniref:GPI ethanolamine phosphate transferase 2 n=1 Tax=Acrobeloides nanus TaxID=290746 RepID=A0A914ERN8_9BILA
MKLVLVCSVIQLIAIFIFGYGFFPPKTSIDIIEHTGLDETFVTDELVHSKDGVKNLVLMVIDAFGERFLYDSTSMAFTRRLIAENRCTTVRAHVQTPTVTLPRLKAMVAGIVPNYMDVILNFASVEFTEDNWLYRIKAQNKKIVFYGDDTWQKMFPHEVFEARSEGTTSFFVNDYTEVDNNVTRHLDFELSTEGIETWNVMILHYIGLDHIGHSMHGRHPQLEIKLAEMDSIVERIYTSLNQHRKLEEFSLVVLGDHGMTEGGNHGGPSDLETLVPIVICPTFDQATKVKKEVKPVMDIEQVDLVPTLATLLQVPIPVNNIGVSFYDLLTSDEIGALRSILTNAVQLQNLLIGIKADVNLDSLQNCITEARAGTRRTNNNSIDGIDEIRTRCKTALHECQDAVISAASYKDHYFILALVLSIVSLIVFAYKSLKFNFNRGHVIIFVQAISIFSSSFTEEEQDTWYFLFPSLLLYELFLLSRTWNAFRRGKLRENQGNNSFKQIFIIMMILVAQRYSRSLTEGMRRRWELFSDYNTFNYTKMDTHIQSAIELLNFGYLQKVVDLGSFVGAAFFLIFTNLSYKKPPSFIILFSFMAILAVKWGNFEESTNFYFCHFTWLCIAALFLMRKFKLAFATWLFLVCRTRTYYVLFLMHLTGYSLPIINSNIEITIFYTVMASSFFFVGNSNSLSAIDISVGYTGLQSYLPILVGIQILLNAYSGPMMVFLGWFGQKQASEDLGSMLTEVLLYRHLAMCISMISLFIQRYHLFLWRVFAPKFLFESVHYMLYLLFLGFIYTFNLPNKFTNINKSK